MENFHTKTITRENVDTGENEANIDDKKRNMARFFRNGFEGENSQFKMLSMLRPVNPRLILPKTPCSKLFMWSKNKTRA